MRQIKNKRLSSLGEAKTSDEPRERRKKKEKESRGTPCKRKRKCPQTLFHSTTAPKAHTACTHQLEQRGKTHYNTEDREKNKASTKKKGGRRQSLRGRRKQPRPAIQKGRESAHRLSPSSPTAPAHPNSPPPSTAPPSDNTNHLRPHRRPCSARDPPSFGSPRTKKMSLP